MTVSNKFFVVSAAAALTAAIAMPAMALENEFHGMYRNFFTVSNFDNGTVNGAGLKAGAESGVVATQRARIMYVAKANDDLKLVTHFELDTRFGGQATGSYKGMTGNNDSGQLGADSITLETKNLYIDYNIPSTGVNVKTGIHLITDNYEQLFCMADVAGITVTKKLAALKLKGGWYRLSDKDTDGTNAVSLTPTALVGELTTDLLEFDGQYAVNKDTTVGASYYNVQRDSVEKRPYGMGEFEFLHMVGLNADIKAGPATIKPYFAYQFGDGNPTGTVKHDISAYLAGVTTNTKIGPGIFNLAGFITSGDKEAPSATSGKVKDFKILSNDTSYGPGNMWLLLRNSTGYAEATVLDTDNTARDRGLMAVFAGYEGVATNKVFYGANVGYMRTSEQRTNVVKGVKIKESAEVGTEINALVGYNMFDNMKARFDVAYLYLGDGLKGVDGQRIGNLGAADASNPYRVSVSVSYSF